MHASYFALYECLILLSALTYRWELCIGSGVFRLRATYLEQIPEKVIAQILRRHEDENFAVFVELPKNLQQP